MGQWDVVKETPTNPWEVVSEEKDKGYTPEAEFKRMGYTPAPAGAIPKPELSSNPLDQELATIPKARTSNPVPLKYRGVGTNLEPSYKATNLGSATAQTYPGMPNLEDIGNLAIAGGMEAAPAKSILARGLGGAFAGSLGYEGGKSLAKIPEDIRKGEYIDATGHLVGGAAGVGLGLLGLKQAIRPSPTPFGRSGPEEAVTVTPPEVKPLEKPPQVQKPMPGAPIPKVETLKGEQVPMEIVPQEQPPQNLKLDVNVPPQPPVRRGSPRSALPSQYESQLKQAEQDLMRERNRLAGLQEDAKVQQATEAKQGGTQMEFPLVAPNEIQSGPSLMGKIPPELGKKPVNPKEFETNLAQVGGKPSPAEIQNAADAARMGGNQIPVEQGTLWSNAELEPFRGNAPEQLKLQRQKVAEATKRVRELRKLVNAPGNLAIGEQQVLATTGEIPIEGEKNSPYARFYEQLKRFVTDPEFKTLQPEEQARVIESIKKVGAEISTPERQAIREAIKATPKPGAVGAPKPVIDPQEFVQQQVLERKIAEDEANKALPLGERIKRFGQDLATNWLSSQAPIQRRLRMIDKATPRIGPDGKPVIKPGENLQVLMGNVPRSEQFHLGALMETGLKDGLVKLASMDKEVGGKALETFEQYIFGKHLLRLKELGVRTGYEPDLPNYANVVAKYKDTFAPFEALVQKFNDRNLSYAVEKGLISPEFAQRSRDLYPDYVPLERIFEKGEPLPENLAKRRKIGSLEYQDIFRTIEGGEKPVKNVIESMLDRSRRLYDEGEKNDVARTIIALGGKGDQTRALPGFGGMREITGIEKFTDSPNVISYLDNGVQRTFEVAPEIASAAKNLGKIELGNMLRMLNLSIRMARTGITALNPAFALANFPKDQMAAMLNSPARRGIGILRPDILGDSLLSVLKRDPSYQHAEAIGAVGSSFDPYRGPAKTTLAQIDAKGSLAKRVKYYLKPNRDHLDELIRPIENTLAISEETTRLQQLNAVKSYWISQGMNPKDAEALGTLAAREVTADFLQAGNYSRAAGSLLLYLNARLQGARVFGRSLRDRTGETFARTMIGVGFPIAAATLYNLSDPKRAAIYKDLYDATRENNLILISPWAYKDPTSNRYKGVAMVPLAAGEGKVASYFRRPLEAKYGMDPVSAKEAAKYALDMFSPVEHGGGSLFFGRETIGSLIPQQIKPAVENTANFNFYTGRPIVPQGIVNKPDRFHYVPGQTPVSLVELANGPFGKYLPTFLGKDPLKTKHWLEGTFGQFGPNLVLDALEKAHGVPQRPGQARGGLDMILGRFSAPAAGGQQRHLKEKLQEEIADR